MKNIIKAILPPLILICLHFSVSAQSVSFGGSSPRISKRMLKKEKAARNHFNKTFDDLRSNISNADSVNKFKKRFSALGYDVSGIKKDDESSVDAFQKTADKYYRPTVMTRKKLRTIIHQLKDSVNIEAMSVRDSTQYKILTVFRNETVNPDSFIIKGDLLLQKNAKKYSSRKAAFRATKLLLRKNYNSRNLFPAAYSVESINFFTSSDTQASKFFTDNSLLFNSSKQKLGYTSEAYNDYFGPVRLGIGYTITSASNDSNEAQNDAVQKIMSSGGNVNYNISYPLLVMGNGETISVKGYLSTRGGIDIPKNSQSAEDYGFMTSSGIVLNMYALGHMNVMQVFLTTRLSYIYGNNNFADRLQYNSFWLLQNSLGLAIKDKFRIRLDYYNGVGGTETNTFVQSHFPVTVSFDIVNPF